MEAERKANLKARAAEEMKAFFLIFIYLLVLFGTFTVYRRLISDEYHISYLHYGYAVIEGLVLAKVILIGQALHLGERHGNHPLYVPVIYKTLCFGLLIIAFELLERAIERMVHGKNALGVFTDIEALGWCQIMAWAIVMVTALVPLFAMMELDGVLGEGTLLRLFFKPKSAWKIEGAPASVQELSHESSSK
jgi:hypothetical protein